MTLYWNILMAGLTYILLFGLLYHVFILFRVVRLGIYENNNKELYVPCFDLKPILFTLKKCSKMTLKSWPASMIFLRWWRHTFVRTMTDLKDSLWNGAIILLGNLCPVGRPLEYWGVVIDIQNLYHKCGVAHRLAVCHQKLQGILKRIHFVRLILNVG